MKYIDVSEWQGVIDWEKAKSSIDGAILRAGYGKTGVDKYFTRNASECNRLGIPIGAYWFSYAKNAEEAKAEAKALLAAVRPYKMELQLAFDFEYDSVSNAKKAGVTVTRDLCSSMVHAFCQTIEAGGYWALNYANPDFLSRYFDATVATRYGLWLAQWPAKVDVTKPPRTCAIWQWGGSNIPGITPGHTVDTNESYQDFKTIITEKGLNNLKPVYADENGDPIYEYTQAKPQSNPQADALKWAQEHNITDDPALALALFRYHAAFGPEDVKNLGGLVAD